MSLTGVLATLVRDPAIADLRSGAAGTELGAAFAADISSTPGATAPLLSLLAAAPPTGAGRPVLAVTATGREAEDLAGALRCFLPPEQVVEFPSWETLPHERLSPRSDTVGRRLAVLRRLAHPDRGAEQSASGPVSVVVAPVRAVLQPLVAGLGDLEPVTLQVGDEMPLEDIVERLVAAAYVRTDLVERRGEFAVRGGILDVFPPTEEHPLRVELFGDTVEEIRWFAVADQRSLQIAPRRAVGAAVPRAADHRRRPRAGGRAGAAPARRGRPARQDRRGHRGRRDGVARARAGRRDGAAARRAAAGCQVVVCDPERVRTRAHDLVATSAGVPAGQLGQRRRRERRAGRPGAGAGHRVVLGPGPPARARRASWGCPGGRSGPSAPTPSWPPEPPRPSLAALDLQPVESYRGETERAIGDLGSLAAGRLAGRGRHRGPGPGQPGGRAAGGARPGRPVRAGRAAGGARGRRGPCR